MTFDVFHKVGDSSCLYREPQFSTNVLVIPALIETQWPPLVICSEDT